MNKIKKILNKKNKSKIVCLTAYSKNFSEEIDKYVDIVLVGDSLGSVLYNYSTTRKVTLTEMINHSKSVKLGIKKSLMVVDMPYKTYDTKKSALKNARKVIKETKCDAVKLEGGKKVIELNLNATFRTRSMNSCYHATKLTLPKFHSNIFTEPPKYVKLDVKKCVIQPLNAKYVTFKTAIRSLQL